MSDRKVVKTRKFHRCFGCEDGFDKGSNIWRISDCGSEGWWTIHLCIPCQQIWFHIYTGEELEPGFIRSTHPLEHMALKYAHEVPCACGTHEVTWKLGKKEFKPQEEYFSEVICIKCKAKRPLNFKCIFCERNTFIDRAETFYCAICDTHYDTKNYKILNLDYSDIIQTNIIDGRLVSFEEEQDAEELF